MFSTWEQLNRTVCGSGLVGATPTSARDEGGVVYLSGTMSAGLHEAVATDVDISARRVPLANHAHSQEGNAYRIRDVSKHD